SSSERAQESTPLRGSIWRQLSVTRTTSTPSESSSATRDSSVPGPYCSHASSWMPLRRYGEASEEAGAARAAIAMARNSNRRTGATVGPRDEHGVSAVYESYSSSSSPKRSTSEGGSSHMLCIGSPTSAI